MGGAGNGIGWAVKELQDGRAVCRAGWNGRGMWLSFVPARDVDQARFLPFVQMRTVDGSFVPWLCSQTDLLARDWVVADPV